MITPLPGYKVDPNNSNGVVPITNDPVLPAVVPPPITPPGTPPAQTSTSPVTTTPPTPATTTTGTPATDTKLPTTTTTVGDTDYAKADRDALAQAQADFQTQAKTVSDTITNIQNGTTPLSAGEQAQLDGLKGQFDTLIQQQQLANKNASGVANIRGYQTGSAEYDPTFQVKTIGSIVSAGAAKVSDLQVKEASAVASLTQAFKDNDIKAVQDAYSVYKDASKERTDALQKTIDDTQKAIKDAQDAKIAADKVQYDTVTKPLTDLASEAAKNGAPTSVLNAINNSKDVSSAIAASGNWLQTATGDLGRYLDYSRQAQATGKVAASYDDWLKADTAADSAKKATDAYNSAYAGAKGKAAGEAAANPDGTQNLKPLTEVQAKDLTYAQRSSQANDIIGNLQSKILAMAPQDYLVQKSAEGNDFLNQYVSADFRQIAQAERNFVTAVLRRESGASIAQSEFDTAAAQYFPRPGDDDTTLAQKTQARQTAIDSFKANVPDYDSRVSDSADSLLTKAEDMATQTLKTYTTSHPDQQATVNSRISTMEKTLGRPVSATEFLQAFPEYN